MSKAKAPKKLKKLSDRHYQFCKEYIVDFNGTQAAIRAGFSEKTAGNISWMLLQDPLILNEIEKLKAERLERTEINADYVLKRLIEIDQMDVADILNSEGTVKSVSDWPKVWRQFISGFDVQELTYDGNPYGLLKKIKWPDKVKNLELLGKHITVQAFNDKLEIKNTDAVEELSDEELDKELARRLGANK